MIEFAPVVAIHVRSKIIGVDMEISGIVAIVSFGFLVHAVANQTLCIQKSQIRMTLYWVAGMTALSIVGLLSIVGFLYLNGIHAFR